MTFREPDEIQKSTHAPELKAGEGDHRQGEVLGGRYRVISFLGQGGMGVVYKVEQIFLGKELALKTIVHTSQSETAVRRFQAEARAVFAVNHPNIVSVHDFGLLDDQTPFLAMEFVKGRTIGELIQARALPLEDALKIFIQVCFGLAHAHKSGVIHRDIKPNNIMVLDGMQRGTEGSVKILDFGIAKLTQHDSGEIQALTRTGEIFGSPIYMSPEQCTGEKIDHRSDIYSLGCVIFETLTGTPPFVGESALSTMMMHQTEATPSLKEASLGINFSPELERVVHTMLAKNPAERYQDLGIAAHDLAAIKSGQLANLSISAKPKSVIKKQAASTISIRKHHFVLWIAGVALVSIAMTFLFMEMWFLSQEKAHSATQPPTAVSAPLQKLDTEKASDALDLHKSFRDGIARRSIRLEGEMINDTDMADSKDYKEVQLLQAKHIGDDVTNKGLSYLADSKILHLIFEDCAINNVDNFSQLKHLSSLDLSISHISDAAISNIAKLKMLSEINLDRCKNISENSIFKLAPSTSLTTIDLGKGHSPSFIKEMHDKMPQCHLIGYDKVTPLWAEAKKSPDLQYENMVHNISKMKSINPGSYAVAECLKNMADIRSEQHRYAETRKLYDQAILQLDKNHNDNALPDYLLSAAVAAIHDNDVPAALPYCDRVVELLPVTRMHNDRILFNRFSMVVNVPLQLNNNQKVIDYCNAVIPLVEQFPDIPKTWDKYYFYSKAGNSYANLNKKAEAFKNFGKIALLSTDDAKTNLFWHATSLVAMGNTAPTDEERKKNYIAGMRMMEEGGMPDTWNLLESYCDGCTYMAAILKKEGDWQQAMQYDKKGLAVAERMMTIPAHGAAIARRDVHAFDMVVMLKDHGHVDEAKALAHKYQLDLFKDKDVRFWKKEK